MLIKGLNHITLVCQDIKKTGNFLCQLFDAKEVYSSGDKTFSIAKEKFFLIGDIWIAVMEGEPIERTYNHIAFQIDAQDLPKFEKKIRELGMTLLPGRAHAPEEGEYLYFYDYDNHLFELSSGDLETRLKYYASM